MRKKKSKAGMKHFPPGLIVFSGSLRELEQIFAGITEDQTRELMARGYHLLGVQPGIDILRLSDQDLKEMGLKRIGQAPNQH
jgi:hypothetical protein